jgi:hypothetical protein
MDILGEKEAANAEQPLYRLNLQLFAEGDEGGGGAPINTPTDPPAGGDPADAGGAADEGGGPGAVTQGDPKSQATDKQHPDNAAFAQMRREAEQAKRELAARDKWVADKFGASHGIKTWAAYQAALDRQEQEDKAAQQKAKEKELADGGLNVEAIKEIIRAEADQRFQQYRSKEEKDRQLVTEFNALAKEYPDLIKEPKDIPAETWAKYEKGYSLIDAFKVTNMDKILERTSKGAAQSALNKLSGKQHLKPDGTSADDLDAAGIPPETMQMYKAMFPKWSMKQIVDDFKKNNPRR